MKSRTSFQLSATGLRPTMRQDPPRPRQIPEVRPPMIREAGDTLRRLLCLVAMILIQCPLPAASAPGARPPERLTRQQLIQDIRELSGILESAHPDPYTNGGGKVAYHRRLQDLIRSVPDDGLSKLEFHVLLQPFVAKLGDGHTTLPLDESARDYANPGGIPLHFEIVEKRLYVGAVLREEDLPLIGSTLESVEGIPLATLLRREREQRGHDNEHHALSGLAGDGALYFRETLRHLVPEWKGRAVRVVLRRPSAELEKRDFSPSTNVTYPLLRNESRLSLPHPDRPFTYDFLDARRQIAYLRIDDMTTYRELFEYSRSVGSPGFEKWARRVYERTRGTAAPDALDEVIAGIPSATETFRALFREMKEAGSRTLVVDLQRNFGGNSLMVQIFLYHLVGFDRTVSLLQRTAAIQKLSPLLDSSTDEGVDPNAVYYSGRVPLTLDDYDFSNDGRFMAEPDLEASIRTSYTRMFEQIPTFHSAFKSREDEAVYFPERIIVLCGNGTQSSGFDLLTDLYRLGAVVVGVPSSQAGNSFGNIRRFQLTHSKIVGYVSTKYFVAYPEQPTTGFTLMPHHELTYDRLSSYGFDRNAAVLYALEIVEAARTGELSAPLSPAARD